jgi:hypothetical protein
MTKMKVLKEILHWSEVWALFIPLVLILFRRNHPPYLKPIIFYVCVALILNISQDVIMKQKQLGIRLSLDNNTFIYHIHSIVRLFLFSWFFFQQQTYFRRVNKVLPILFIVISLVNFIWFEKFYGGPLSSRLLSFEAAILLFYCLQYYFFLLKEEQTSYQKLPSFWIVTGLSIYVVVNFPIFLFYKTLTSSDAIFAIDIWDVHNISFIIFCIFLGKGIYEGTRERLVG